jgi:hypothetical protein
MTIAYCKKQDFILKVWYRLKTIQPIQVNQPNEWTSLVAYNQGACNLHWLAYTASLQPPLWPALCSKHRTDMIMKRLSTVPMIMKLSCTARKEKWVAISRWMLNNFKFIKWYNFVLFSNRISFDEVFILEHKVKQHVYNHHSRGHLTTAERKGNRSL